MSEPKITRRKLSDYRPAEVNPNRGTARGVPAIIDSLHYAGAGRSLLVDKDGEAIAGSHTLQAAMDAGFDDVIEVETTGRELVVVRRADLDLTTDARARALQLADNRTTILGYEQDDELVAELLTQIGTEDVQLVQAAGFDERDVRELMDRIEGAQPPEDFAAYDESIETQYCCPKCGYKWSGKANLSAQPRCEQYVLTTAPDVYQFFRDEFFEAMIGHAEIG